MVEGFLELVELSKLDTELGGLREEHGGIPAKRSACAEDRASAEERLTRGFISMTTIRPVFGSTANWILQPPVVTPTSETTIFA